MWRSWRKDNIVMLRDVQTLQACVGPSCIMQCSTQCDCVAVRASRNAAHMNVHILGETTHMSSSLSSWCCPEVFCIVGFCVCVCVWACACVGLCVAGVYAGVCRLGQQPIFCMCRCQCDCVVVCASPCIASVCHVCVCGSVCCVVCIHCVVHACVSSLLPAGFACELAGMSVYVAVFAALSAFIA